MSERKCELVFLPARDDKIEGVCVAPVDGDSRNCAEHGEEMLLAEGDLAASSYEFC
jgi:hypothetical protein